MDEKPYASSRWGTTTAYSDEWVCMKTTESCRSSACNVKLVMRDAIPQNEINVFVFIFETDCWQATELQCNARRMPWVYVYVSDVRSICIYYNKTSSLDQ